MDTRSAHREMLMKEQGIGIPSTPILSMKGYLCFRCLRHTASLSACSGCKRLSYCSKQCQKLDWGIEHKERCKVFKAVNQYQAAQTPACSWQQYTDHLYNEVLSLKALHKDQEIASFIEGQPYCSTCYHTSPQLPATTVLEPCPQCHTVFTCTTCPDSHTPATCKAYQQTSKEESFQIEAFEKFGKTTTNFPTDQPRKSYSALSTAKTWFEYYTQLSDKDMIQVFVNPDFTFIPDMADKIPQMTAKATESLWLALRFATETSSMPLSILAALEECVADVENKPELRIHLVGAAAKELVNLAIFEELLHLLPSLKQLHFVLVGPNLGPGDSHAAELKADIPLTCCPSCQAQERKRTVSIYTGQYHLYAATPHYKKPDLAVLFHSGRSEEQVESWAPTTRMLVESETTTLCTAYTEKEMLQEVEELKWLGASLLVEPQVNTWRSIVSQPDLLRDIEHARYYQNYYRYVFRGFAR